MIKSFFRIVGGLVASISPLIGLITEVPELAPMWQQLLVWAGFAILTMIGYSIYRAAGGTFTVREMFESE